MVQHDYHQSGQVTCPFSQSVPCIQLELRKEMWLLKNLKNVVFSLNDASVFYFNQLNILTYLKDN